MPPPLDWIIAEGESQNGALQITPDAAHSLRDQHVRFGVDFVSKRHGEYIEVAECAVIPANEQQKQTGSENRIVANGGHATASQTAMTSDANHRWMMPIGTKDASLNLDGHKWKQFPRFT